MFIWTKNGNKLVKTEDIKTISLEEETGRELHHVTQAEVYILRAYFTVDDRKNSVILASYNDTETAREQFSGLICAIGQGAKVFSLCWDPLLAGVGNGKSEPEEVLEMEP